MKPWIDTNIFGAVTLKDLEAPEANNMALHVCINEEAVLQNRTRLAQELNLPLTNWCLPWQKHTANLHIVQPEDIGKGARDKETSLMNVDALYTNIPRVLIGVFTADCVGILLADESTPSLCAIHSGWKGTAQAITYRTLEQLKTDGLIDIHQTKAYFSPSILKESLEVGLEVVEQIQTMGKEIDLDVAPFIFPGKPGKAYIDNQGLNKAMLQKAGLKEEQIFLSHQDTKKELADCFSYRNDKKCGEHFTFGYIK